MTDRQAGSASSAAPGAEEALFRELVGRHADYYLAIRRRMDQRDNDLVWNWWAFLLNVPWLLMKRMWGAAIAVTAAYALFYAAYTEYIVTGILVPSWASPQATAAAIALLNLAQFVGVPLFCGLFGNKLYVTYVDARVRARLKASGATPAG